ncbi:hypothetical protein JCM10212_004238 [Sporobolomyces blumeae]
MAEPYRPRRPTRKEIRDEVERQSFKRKQQVIQRGKERKLLSVRSSKMKYSGLSGVGYQDYTLGRSNSIRSRTQIDRKVYEQAREKLRERDGEEVEPARLDSVRSLADCCLEVVAEHYGESGVFDRLDPVHHRAHVNSLVERVVDVARRGDEATTSPTTIPYEVWLELAVKVGIDLPGRRKTYRGLVVADVGELEALRDLNEESLQAFVREPSLVPPFFLASLDLSNDQSFTDSDVYKLREPLSTFLAVLKLDKTSITDVGLNWISRATTGDPKRYKHLELLSLKGLRGVTNEGVVRFAKLENLRLLDVRDTGCNSSVMSLLNSATTTCVRPFRNPLPRHNLGNTLYEFQLFGGSLSLSRILSSLHHLAKVEHSTTSERYRTIKAPLVKPLSVHLTAMTRRTAPSREVDPSKKSAEQLYHDQLSLAGYLGSAMATHHATFGSITSTKSIARCLVEDDGRAIAEKGVAFRAGNESVAAGEWIGEGKYGGRATLFDVGMRRIGGGTEATDEWDPFSDTEDEHDKEEERRRRDDEAMAEWQAAASSRFYRGPAPQATDPKQTIVAAEQSIFMLVRHLPYVEPWDRKDPTDSVPEHVESESNRLERVGRPAKSTEHGQVREGLTLVKKRRKVEPSLTSAARTTLDLSQPTTLYTSSPAIQAAAQPRTSRRTAPTPFSLDPPSPSSASPSANRPPPLATPTPAQRPRPSASQPSGSMNPFSKRSTPSSGSGARTERKNIVKCGPALTSRSGLTAFRR